MITDDFDNKTLYLIYDDECPLCRHSAQALNIKQAVSNLVLINARQQHPLVDKAWVKGFDLDQGIVVIYSDQYYYGADAVHFLAMLDSPSSYLNAIVASIFRVKLITRLLYPVIKCIRRLLLKQRGVEAIKR